MRTDEAISAGPDHRFAEGTRRLPRLAVVFARGLDRRLFRGGPILQTCQQPPQSRLDPLPLVAVQPVLHRGIAGQLGQNSVAGGHLRQMQFRFNADPLEGLQLLRRQRIVEIFGDRVGVFREAATIRLGGADRGPPHSRADAFHQMGRHHAGRNLPAKFLLLIVGKHAVEPGQQCSERETHGAAPGRC